jgi:hypothetical protein
MRGIPRISFSLNPGYPGRTHASTPAWAFASRVYPFPAPLETVAELRARLGLAEERLTDLKAMLEDMRRDRDAWREQAQTRLLPAPAAPMSWWRWLRTTG